MNSKYPAVDAQYAYEMVEQCAAIAPRGSGSQGTSKFLKFISAEIKSFGLPVVVDRWTGVTPIGNLEFCNVSTEIKGKSDDFILVASHYDTKKLVSVPDFQGANDGGSSTGLLLALIKAFKEHSAKPALTLKFLFFDGEECIDEYSENDGLFGSKHLSAKWKKDGTLKRCRGVVLLDMIGDKDLNVTLPSGADEKLKKLLLRIAAKQNKSKFFSEYSSDIIDDHTPFQKEGIPTVDIIDFDFGPNNRYWHTRADTMDKISRESLATVGNVTAELLWNMR